MVCLSVLATHKNGGGVELRHEDERLHRRFIRNAMLTGALACALAAGQQIRPASAHFYRAHARHAFQNRFWHTEIFHRSRYVRRRLEEAHAKPPQLVAHRDEGDHIRRSFEAYGLASVYSGGRTASGESMRPGAMTAAHRTLPFGTQVTVVNSRNGRSVMVRINDRGPFVHGRVIDLSPAAAHAIGVNGLAPVSLQVHG
jgi:rare lipoprotein A